KVPRLIAPCRSRNPASTRPAHWLGQARGQPLPEPAGQQGVDFSTSDEEGQMETYDPHKSTTEVRQGSRTLDNFWVLVISVVAVIAVFAIIFLVFFANTPPSVPNP